MEQSELLRFVASVLERLDIPYFVTQAIARATVNAARTFEVFRGRGTLNVGAVADIALLELREGNFDFLDDYGNKIPGRQRLFPSGTVLGGKRIPRA